MSGNAWSLSLGRAASNDGNAGLDYEWLVTNGLGGYASGSLTGATTRSYHGLLVAALRPPVERYVLVTKVDEEIVLSNGQTLRLGVNEYQDGTIDPQGYRYLSSFDLEGDIPCFTYDLEEHVRLEKRIWMEYGENTTYVQYILRDETSERRTEPLMLTLFPFCLYRDHHNTTQGRADWRFTVESLGNGCQIRAYEGAQPYQLWLNRNGHFTPNGFWYWHVHHRRDRERGLPCVEDVYQPGTLRVPLMPGSRVTLVISAQSQLDHAIGGIQHEEHAAQALRRHQRRIKQLLDIADRTTPNLAKRDPVHARLVIAADQFIVVRPQQDESKAAKTKVRLSPDSKTIIAGYPWFTDWGRDSMVSLPGLLLHTGRYSEARGLLRAFASYVHEGIIPNR
ncbi:MAG TPA: glycogen debranching enzyme N-terminal domain-containing protein, partial [Ktedonobacteraceae bacterium]|nr:glycogen debranching enzyme N-terminal domain-containing protein [Ktedonobacteraceae bacterium]